MTRAERNRARRIRAWADVAPDYAVTRVILATRLLIEQGQPADAELLAIVDYLRTDPAVAEAMTADAWPALRLSVLSARYGAYAELPEDPDNPWTRIIARADWEATAAGIVSLLPPAAPST